MYQKEEIYQYYIWIKLFEDYILEENMIISTHLYYSCKCISNAVFVSNTAMHIYGDNIQGPPNLWQRTFWPGSRIKTKKIVNLLQQIISK